VAVGGGGGAKSQVPEIDMLVLPELLATVAAKNGGEPGE
jgi:hypothetical protein